MSNIKSQLKNKSSQKSKPIWINPKVSSAISQPKASKGVRKSNITRRFPFNNKSLCRYIYDEVDKLILNPKA